MTRLFRVDYRDLLCAIIMYYVHYDALCVGQKVKCDFIHCSLKKWLFIDKLTS